LAVLCVVFKPEAQVPESRQLVEFVGATHPKREEAVEAAVISLAETATASTKKAVEEKRKAAQLEAEKNDPILRAKREAAEQAAAERAQAKKVAAEKAAEKKRAGLEKAAAESPLGKCEKEIKAKNAKIAAGYSAQAEANDGFAVGIASWDRVSKICNGG